MTESLSQPNLPWAPIYTVCEPGRPEHTISGIVYAWSEDRSLYANAGRSLLRIGDTRMPLWSHSLLNPFLLMTLLPTFKTAYPALTPEHLATLMGNTTGDPRQRQLLNDIETLAGIDPETLHCTACPPASEARPDSPPCLSLHLTHELYRRTRDADTAPMHALLRELLTYLLNREDFAESTEHCNLPTLALSAVEITQLYHALILPIPRDLIRQCPDELTDSLECWNEISGLMREQAAALGGGQGLDTHLMETLNHQNPPVPLIAKADPGGLLCAGIGPNPNFADGLGLYVQLAPNQAPNSLGIIANGLLHQLGLTAEDSAPPTVRFQFDLQSSVLPT